MHIYYLNNQKVWEFLKSQAAHIKAAHSPYPFTARRKLVCLPGWQVKGINNAEEKMEQSGKIWKPVPSGFSSIRPSPRVSDLPPPCLHVCLLSPGKLRGLGMCWLIPASCTHHSQELWVPWPSEYGWVGRRNIRGEQAFLVQAVCDPPSLSSISVWNGEPLASCWPLAADSKWQAQST